MTYVGGGGGGHRRLEGPRGGLEGPRDLGCALEKKEKEKKTRKKWAKEKKTRNEEVK